ncbi:MAG: hypothetical protein ACI8UO_005980 [Verrucomicrobiales bacterium]|jgi:hypothetical protein
MPNKSRSTTKSAKTKTPKPPARKTAGKRSKGQTGITSDDEIRVAAYHVYEHRIGNGHHGDHSSDWFEAKRMLS